MTISRGFGVCADYTSPPAISHGAWIDVAPAQPAIRGRDRPRLHSKFEVEGRRSKRPEATALENAHETNSKKSRVQGPKALTAGRRTRSRRASPPAALRRMAWHRDRRTAGRRTRRSDTSPDRRRPGASPDSPMGGKVPSIYGPPGDSRCAVTETPDRRGGAPAAR